MIALELVAVVLCTMPTAAMDYGALPAVVAMVESEVLPPTQARKKSSRLATFTAIGCDNKVGPSAVDPILLLSHHKTGTFFAAALFRHICTDSCCVHFHQPQAADIVSVVRRYSAQHCLRFALVAFAGQLSLPLLWPHSRLVHFTRHPMQVLRSAFDYHHAGHEDYPIRLTLSDDGGLLTSGRKNRSAYCASDNSSRAPAVLDLIHGALDSLAAAPGLTHAALLRRLSDDEPSKGFEFEAAWNYCELMSMVSFAAEPTPPDREGSVRALRLDINQVERWPVEATAALAAFVGGGHLDGFRASTAVLDRHKSTHSTERAAHLLHRLQKVPSIRRAFQALVARYEELAVAPPFWRPVVGRSGEMRDDRRRGRALNSWAA